MKKFIFSLVILASFTSETLAQDSTISQTAEGVVSAAPDEALIFGGVVSTSSTVSKAVSQNTIIMNKVIANLKSASVTDENIKTVKYSIEPHYTYSDKSSPVRDGYVVTNKLKIKAVHLDQVGIIIDAMTNAGVNEIDGIIMSNSNADKLINNARKNAVSTAIQQAAVIADALGYSLGSVVTVNEQTNNRREFFNPAALSTLSTSRESTPISGGTQDFKVTVQVTWKLIAIR